MPARNEAWVIGLSARVALAWCDTLIVLQHACTDETAVRLQELQDEYRDRVHVLVDPDPVWREQLHRQRLLDAAREHGATHVALVDADEVLCGDALGTIRATAADLARGNAFMARMPCVWRSPFQYRVDPGLWSDRDDLCFLVGDAPAVGWMVAAAYPHHSRHPQNVNLIALPSVGVMHLQWASWRRLLAKQAWYKMYERVHYPDKDPALIDDLYSPATRERGLRVCATPESWWAPYTAFLPYLDCDAVPWHEAECRQFSVQYGAAYFAGLDLFGVV